MLHSARSMLRAKLSAVGMALIVLVACNEKCCFVGPVGGHDCGAIGGRGECGLTACVFIGVDATSLACATGDGGFNPNFLQDVAHRGANATYSITTRTFGVPDVTNTFKITLSAGDKLFLGCGQVNGGPTTPSQNNYFKLVSYDMLSNATQASLRPAKLPLDEAKKTARATPVVAPKGYDVQTCDQLCKQANRRVENAFR
jgi:hypothetical protein